MTTAGIVVLALSLALNLALGGLLIWIVESARVDLPWDD